MIHPFSGAVSRSSYVEFSAAVSRNTMLINVTFLCTLVIFADGDRSLAQTPIKVVLRFKRFVPAFQITQKFEKGRSSTVGVIIPDFSAGLQNYRTLYFLNF